MELRSTFQSIIALHQELTQTYSFEQLYKENYARLYYYAFRFITDEEVCKDIVNDVFEKAWQHFGELKPETASAYLYDSMLVANRSIGSTSFVGKCSGGFS